MTEDARPAEVAPGQRWGFWAYDFGLYVRMTIDRVGDNGFAYGRDEDGSPCVCGLARFEDAEYLGGGRP